MSMPLEIRIVPALNDNYMYAVTDPQNGDTAVIDPSESEPIQALLKKESWKVRQIMATHHHWDHVGGLVALKETTGARVVVSRYDLSRIAGADEAVGETDVVRIGRFSASVLEIPGHTLGHVAYYFAEAGSVFCGDTLFSLGCGRLFEGTADQMWSSLSKLMALPDDTRIYCGHEYTVGHGAFVRSIDPANPALESFLKAAEDLRAEGKSTLPTTLGMEKRLNPFLRVADPAFRAQLGLSNATAAEAFAFVRKKKDSFGK